MNIQHNHTALSHRTAIPTAASHLTALASQFFYESHADYWCWSVRLHYLSKTPTNENPEQEPVKLGLRQLRRELYGRRSSSSPGIIIPQNLYRCLWNAATLASPKGHRPAGATAGESTSSTPVRRECYLIEDEAERRERKLGGSQPLAFCQNNWMCKKMFLKKPPDRMCTCNSVSFFTLS